MRAPLWPTELSRHDLAYAAEESNRALPPYQGGPFDRLGRGQRKAEVSVFQAAKPARAFKARCRAGGAPSIEERGGADPHRHERMRAAARCRPGPSAVRERSRSRARRRRWGTRARTWTLLGQGQTCCLITPFPIVLSELRAPPENRTLFAGLRVRCITVYACGT